MNNDPPGTTESLSMPTEFQVPDERSAIVNTIEADQQSASRMLRVMMMFAWGLALAVNISALMGYGTALSNKLAVAWLVVLSVFLLVWPKLNLTAHRLVSLLFLFLLTARWTEAWLFAEPADAMIGVLIGLLYTPVLVIITTLLWGRRSIYIGVTTGLIMGGVATIGSWREALSAAYLNDWRIGPLVLCVYALFAWLLGIWVRQRDELRESMDRIERLRRAANTDTLTGIANRRVAERALSQFAGMQRRYAVMMIDIDHFKKINDTHGHDTGDRILQRVAEVLKSRMRAHDTVARWGGEEFLVIVESVSRAEAASIAESLRARVEEDSAAVLPTTISIGVAHTESGQSVDQIVKRADEGLYAAKNSGRNRVVTL